MSKKYKYIVPEGIAQSFWVGAEKIALGPGEYEFDDYRYCSGVILTRPHWEFNTSRLRKVQNINKTTPACVNCLFTYRQEIVNPTKYINCHTPIFQVYNDKTEAALDGEEYIYDTCVNIISAKLCSLTFEEMCILKDTEVDLSRETCFPEYQKKVFDEAGVKITQIKLIITGIHTKEEL